MNNRIERLVQELPDSIDCAVITSDVGRFYLTGMRSSAGTLVVTRDKSYFIIDFRYIEKAKKLIKNAEVVLHDKLYEQVLGIFAQHNVKTVQVENAYMTLSEYSRMKEKLPGIELLMGGEVSDIVTKLRSHKDAQELAAIQAAQAITDKGFSYMLQTIEPGRTERELAVLLQSYMMTQGAEKLSFDTICVSGVNSSMPHGVPTHKKVEKGDFITMDFGVVVDGYCSDMTRTVAVDHVTDEMEKVYSTVLRAQMAALATIQVGVPNSQIDKVARDLIYSAGYEGCFGHGLGHSVGIEIHENPRYSMTGEGVCEVGQIMTVEPGIYLEGKFGVRIEDMVFIGENGVQNLTNSPKDLIIL